MAPKPGSRGTLKVVLLLAPFAFLGGMATDQAVWAKDRGTYRQLDVFSRVLSYIENNYVEEVPNKQLIGGAIKGMVSTLDPHTIFMPPEVFKEVKVDTSGEFGGLGMEVTIQARVKDGVRSEALTVVSPIDDTPAARAGVKAGDLVLKINGEPTADMDLMTAVSRMRGPPGSRVVLTLMREGFAEPRDIVVLRDQIRIIPVEAKLFDGYGWVKVKSFQDKTDSFLKRRLDDLRRENSGELKGVVLDLRNNPGGLLDQAVRVSDRFLPAGKLIVSTKGRGGRHVEEERGHDGDTEPNYPMVVLVNAGSASAAEIVAGALQDHRRAVVMGTTSFGKGSVQTLIELEDGSGLKLTVARYFTPSGRSIQEKGIVPDVEIANPAEGEPLPREVDLKNHFRNDFAAKAPGRAQKDARPATGEPQVEPAAAALPAEVAADPDPVLRAALDYLKSAPKLKAEDPPRKKGAR